MKRIILFTMLVAIVQLTISQEKSRYYTSYPRQADIQKENKLLQKPSETIKYCGNQRDEDVVIGTTWYDLQTHGTMQNRIQSVNDYEMGAVWMMADYNGEEFESFGTGYNFGATCYDRNDLPDEPIEPENAYFPSYSPYLDGEIIVAHTDSNCFIFSQRDTAGQGDWSHFKFYGPEGGPGIVFPSMVVSGENHDTIHILALTTPVAYGGSLYQGQDGALLYSRSTDCGQTWDPHHLILDGLDSSFYKTIKPQTYVFARPMGNTLAFIVFDGMRDGIVMKSTDNGDTWSRLEFFDAPWDGGDLPENTGIFGGGDGSNDVSIDIQGKVNLVFGRLCHRMEAGTEYWYPWSNGIVYWNEYKPDVLDTAKVGSDPTNPQWLEENGYLVTKLNYLDSLRDTLSGYYSSLTGMVQLFTNMYHGFLRVYYSAPVYGYEQNARNYRHIFSIASNDTGNNWYWNMDYTGDIFHLFSESVYPAISDIDDYWSGNYFIYQSDNRPGSFINQQHDPHDNNIVIYPNWLYSDITEKNIPKQDFILSQNYPNPFHDKTYIKITLDQSCKVSIDISEMNGRLLYHINKGNVHPGAHFLEISDKNLNPGIYFYTVYAGGFSETKKMIVY